VQNDWAEAAQADKENDGHSVSSVTEIKSFGLESADEMSFMNEINGSLESKAVAIAAEEFWAGRWALWMDDLLVRTVMMICMH
jgi:hypothetical protein